MSHRAVVLTTHSMEEAEALCKRIGIMVFLLIFFIYLLINYF